MSSVAMSRAVPRFFASTIGKKVVMAVSGAILFGFAIGHMLGNVQAYMGRAQFNAYAEALKANPALLWGIRSILIGAVIAHIVSAFALVRANRAARPTKYAGRTWRKATFASRTMLFSGLILLWFILYHLAHFTTGQAHPHFNPHDPYGNFVTGFKHVPSAIFYELAMACLGLHLIHGSNSLFQSLGLRNPRWAPPIRKLTALATGAVVVVNMSFPLAVLAGVIK